MITVFETLELTAQILLSVSFAGLLFHIHSSIQDQISSDFQVSSLI